MTIGVVVKNNTESTIFTQKSRFYAKIQHSFGVYKNAPQQCVRSPFFHRIRSFLRDFPEKSRKCCKNCQNSLKNAIMNFIMNSGTFEKKRSLRNRLYKPFLRPQRLVRVTGLEPVRQRHTPLKRACLPIPAHSLILFLFS